MDVLLGQVTNQAMNYAIRSGIAITSGYAIKQCGRLLKEVPRSEKREELVSLQLRLESKIRVISPSIDMIELIAARGNTSLESAVSLTKDIRYRIQRLAIRLSSAANAEELLSQKGNRAKSREDNNRELSGIILESKSLLAQIEDAVPLINLAITTSGVNLSTKLSGSVSPSRLLQASTFLTAADTEYTANPWKRQQVGPAYTLSVYMLFAGHVRPTEAQGVRETTWKEVIHKSRVKLWRVPLDELYNLPGEEVTKAETLHTIPADSKSIEFAYQLVLIEDLDDDRHHTVEDGAKQPGPIDGVSNSGIRDIVPIHQVSKVFYADTGKILGIGGDGDLHNPILLLKRDVMSEPPRRMLQQSCSFQDILESVTQPESLGAAQSSKNHAKSDVLTSLDEPIQEAAHHASQESAWRLPPDLDPEWIALEVYSEEPESGSENEASSVDESPSFHRSSSSEPGLVSGLSRLVINSSPFARSSPSCQTKYMPSSAAPSATADVPTSQAIRTNLSLLEMLVKLAALQQFRQESHLAVEDELLNFFLEESGTAGAGTDKDKRQRIRHDAVRRVGFDPYDESPIKRRGEEYIQHANHSPIGSDHNLRLPYDDAYDYHGGSPTLAPSNNFDHTSSGSSSPPAKPPMLSPMRGLHQHLQTPSRSSTPNSAFNADTEPSKSRLPLHDGAATTSSTFSQQLQVTPRKRSDTKTPSPLVNVATSDDK